MNTEVSARSTWHNLHSSNSPTSDVSASWSGEPCKSASRYRRHTNVTCATTAPFPMKTSRSATAERQRHVTRERVRCVPTLTIYRPLQVSHMPHVKRVAGLAGKKPNRQKLVPYNAISTTITFVLVGGGADPWQRRPEGHRKAICRWLRLLHSSKTPTSLAVTADIETERKCHL